MNCLQDSTYIDYKLLRKIQPLLKMGKCNCSNNFTRFHFEIKRPVITNHENMKTKSLSILLLISSFIFTNVKAQSPLSWAESAQGSGNVWPTKTVKDASGNIFISGYFDGIVDFDPSPTITTNLTAAGKDIFIAKYNSSGSCLWVKQIGGPEDEYVNEIAITPSGSILITGDFNSSTVDFDPSSAIQILSSTLLVESAFVVKYDTNGGFIRIDRYGSYFSCSQHNKWKFFSKI
jgi:hypothetical protein